MRPSDLVFLKDLTEAPSPSGFEQPAAKVFRDFVTPFADSVETNVMGSVHARLKGKGKGKGLSVMLAGHIDEVGMMVQWITPEGFIAFKPIGGVDAAILPGMRVDVHTKTGVLRGVMGRLPIHLIEEDQRKSITKIEKLFIDLGLPAERVKTLVRIGDPVTYGVGFETFGDGMAVARAFDDKMGAYICARVLQEVKKAGGAKGDLIAAAATAWTRSSASRSRSGTPPTTRTSRSALTARPVAAAALSSPGAPTSTRCCSTCSWKQRRRPRSRTRSAPSRAGRGPMRTPSSSPAAARRPRS
jgi:hypothetical protein